jgi:hypothetical protein
VASERQQAWYQANRDRILADRKARRAADPAWAEQCREYRRAYHRRARGIVEADGARGPDQCEVCGEPGRTELDHDHTTGLVRGWLCRGCNAALGMAADSPATLRRLAAYLDAHELRHR